MGNKSRHQKKNKGGPLHKGLAAVPAPTTATLANIDIFETVYLLMASRNFVKGLQVESKYRHLQFIFLHNSIYFSSVYIDLHFDSIGGM